MPEAQMWNNPEGKLDPAVDVHVRALQEEFSLYFILHRRTKENWDQEAA